PPTVGAALIIWAGSGRQLAFNKVLSLRLLVLVGLISYSLYLWHWPVLAFYRYAVGTIETVMAGVLFGVMIVLSVCSYRLVEKPCRRLRLDFKGVMLKPVGGGAAVLSFICLSLITTKGFGFYSFDHDYRENLAALE